MRYRYQLVLVGCALFVVAAVRGGWLIPVAGWLGSNFVAVGIAHWTSAHRVMGKKSDGTIAPWAWLVFLPFLAYTAMVWHLARLFMREPALNTVTDDLTVGRRLLPSEASDEFDNYVDLTAEFAEPGSIRRSSAYLSFPILDGAAPSPDTLRAAVGRLRPGKTFIHCAQGHGRTGLFALSVLLARGTTRSVEDGLCLLLQARPGIRLNRQQLNCIRRYAERLD